MKNIRKSDGVYLIFKTGTLGTDTGNISDSLAHMQLKNKKLYTSTWGKGEKGEHFRQHLPQNSTQVIHLRHEYHRKFQKDKNQNYFIYMEPNESLQKSTKST